MSLQKFPGLIDVHVHLRDPGATQKEDFLTGTRAAIAGGFTRVLDMPNNPTPTVTLERLDEKIMLAKQKAVCDIGFHYGTDGNNLSTFTKAAAYPQVFGLKIYCNHTTGTLLIDDKAKVETVFQAWEFDKPILVHAEGEQLAYAIFLTKKYNRRLHVCHITQETEVTMVADAKNNGILVTAGVTPHHLFLTQNDVVKLGSFGIMKPPIGTQQDQDALWEGVTSGVIDVVESDHAPHTKEEKAKTPPPFGVPGLETTLGLLLLAAQEKRLPQELVPALLYDRPRKIFSIPEQQHTYIELDTKEPYPVGEDTFQTKCNWSPFTNLTLYGKVWTVVYKGKTLLAQGKFV
jgi:carbamoyl-phosphate synthase/aspartate carbamoyltransferase/dihydroorotase